MAAPKITWYAKMKDDLKFSQQKTIYAGTCTCNDSITVNIQVWNNRYGLTEVDMLKNFNFVMYFKDLEDSALLENCSIYYKEEKISLNIENKKIIFNLNKDISGKENDGSSTNQNNVGNFIAFDFVFENTSQRIKENDLKQLVLEIVEK